MSASPDISVRNSPWVAKLGPALLLVAALVLAACGGGRAGDAARFGPRVDYLEADLATLIERANAWTAAGLRGRGELRMYWSGDDDSRHVNVRFFATSSGALMLRGSRSLAGRIFDMVANGVDFQLVVPDHGAHYLGAATAPTQPDPERPYFALRPQHMTEALLPAVLPTSNAPGAFVLLVTYPDRYALEWMEIDAGQSRIRRRVWIERVALRVSQIEGFDADGRIEFVADYSDYLGSGIGAYPGVIEVERPWEELVFRFDLSEAERNPNIPAGAFQFQELPPGYRTLTIEEAMAESRRGRGG